MSPVKVTRKPQRGKRSLITEDTRDLIITDYNNGMSQYAIATKYNLSQTTISRIIRERMKLYG